MQERIHLACDLHDGLGSIIYLHIFCYLCLQNELFETMVKRSKQKQSARFHIVTRY
jgi:hypothetical protein